MQPTATDPVVGIDLGTTNSLIAIADASGPRILARESGADLVPSVVRYGPEGVEAVGRPAADALRDHPERTVYSFKRFMGRTLADRETEAEAAVFGRLELKSFPALSIISLVTENMSSRGIGIATLRTSEHDEGYYSATISLSSSEEVDYKWLESEIAELSHKFNTDLEFKKLNPMTN